MKNFLLSLTLFFFGQVNAQCVKLYVKEHLSGSPICNLSQGDYIEICEDDNEVNGCPYDFYVYDKGSSYGSLTYELSLDRGWSTHYMTLLVNPTTKRFGFILQGQTAMYSYYTESEMEAVWARQSEQQRINNQKLVEQAQANDQKNKIDINSALERKEYFIALQLFNELNYKDNDLLTKINAGWLQEKERYSLIYKDYTAEFNQVKNEYFTSEKDFYSKYQKSIKSKEISINGKDAYAKRIASTSDPVSKVYRENILNQDGYVYTKKNNKHLICPVGIDGNYYLGRYNEQIVNKLNIALIYDTSANTYVPLIQFYKNEDLLANSPIVNTSVFQTNYFLMPFPTEINALYEKVKNESGRKMLESLYPQKMLYLNSNEPIALSGLITLSYPGDGKRNDKYEALKSEFENVRRDVEKLAKDKNKLFTKNFYNPSILYLVKKLYPNADTLVFAFGDYKESLGNLGLHIDYDMRYRNMEHSRKIEYSGAQGGSFVPLTKGVVELKNNKFVVYDKMGNYKEVSANLFLPESKLPLKQLEIDKLNLDSTFIKGNFDSNYDIGYLGQYPIFYEQFEMGSDLNRNVDYIFNESLIFQILPLYENTDTKLPNTSRSIYDPMYNLALNFNCRNSDLTFDGVAKKYFKEMTNYFEFKNEKNSEKAMKSLSKANQYLESFKQIYFDPKYDKTE